jgi:hypothetical protein
MLGGARAVDVFLLSLLSDGSLQRTTVESDSDVDLCLESTVTPARGPPLPHPHTTHQQQFTVVPFSRVPK